MALECIVKKKNIGRSKCRILPSMFRGMITTPDNFKMTPEEAEDDAEWQDLLLVTNPDNRGYLWPWFVNIEPSPEDAVYLSTMLTDLKVRDGKYIWTFLFNEDLCTHKKMYTHNANGGRVFFIDVEGNIFGTEDAQGNFMGFKISLLNVEKFRINDGTNPTLTPVRVVLGDSKEMTKSGAMVDGSFVNTLQPLTDVDVTVLTAPPVLAASFKVAVKTDCDGLAVSGLLAADFILLKNDGTANSPFTAIEDVNNPGQYTIAKSAADFVDGTITLRNPAALTVKAYESTGPAVVNVP